MPILLHLVHTFRKTSPLRDRVAAWFHQHTITSDQFDGPNLYTDVVFFETRRAQWYYAYHTLLRHKHHAGKFVFREGAQVDQQGCVQISNISGCVAVHAISNISVYCTVVYTSFCLSVGDVEFATQRAAQSFSEPFCRAENTLGRTGSLGQLRKPARALFELLLRAKRCMLSLLLPVAILLLPFSCSSCPSCTHPTPLRFLL
jgi:hypothetical protein